MFKFGFKIIIFGLRRFSCLGQRVHRAELIFAGESEIVCFKVKLRKKAKLRMRKRKKSDFIIIK